MIYSAGCEYAIRALTLLAARGPAGRHFLLRDLLADQNMPQHFVGKLFQTLIRAGLLSSAKGRGGGFALNRPAEQIHLRDIVEAIDGRERLSRCILGLAACDDKQPCPQHDDWTKVRRQIDDLMDRTTLAHLRDAWAAKAHPTGRGAQ